MPLLAPFSEIRLCHAEEGSTVCTAGFSICEGVRGAVTQLPVAHSSFGYIDEEGDTGSKNADQSSSNPSRAGIEGSDQSISNTRPGVNETKAVRIFDLTSVNWFIPLSSEAG